MIRAQDTAVALLDDAARRDLVHPPQQEPKAQHYGQQEQHQGHEVGGQGPGPRLAMAAPATTLRGSFPRGSLPVVVGFGDRVATFNRATFRLLGSGVRRWRFRRLGVPGQVR